MTENAYEAGPEMSTYDLGSIAGSHVAFQQLEMKLSDAGVNLDPEVGSSTVYP
jgi:hypothetical protein